MITVSVLGSGNVAQHLVAALGASEKVKLVEVYSRNIPAFIIPETVSHTTSLRSLLPADLYIIAISDSAVADVSSRLPFKDCLVVHTSGSLPYSVINPCNRRGVFYPLQTFSRNKAVDLKSVPLCLETEFETDYDLLSTVASAITGQIHKIGHQQRKALHVAAVFVNNFANHLYVQAAKICEQHDISFDILKPLILETADKVLTLPPVEAQTGPAVRNDSNTLQAHIDLITDPTQTDIYQLLTKAIQEHGKKL